jgi:hypothetical protein
MIFCGYNLLTRRKATKRVELIIMANRGGFSWKRAFGVTRIKRRISRATGIPLTKSGRQRKLGALMGGCLLSVLVLLFLIYAAIAGD